MTILLMLFSFIYLPVTRITSRVLLAAHSVQAHLFIYILKEHDMSTKRKRNKL